MLDDLKGNLLLICEKINKIAVFFTVIDNNAEGDKEKQKNSFQKAVIVYLKDHIQIVAKLDRLGYKLAGKNLSK